MPLLSLSHALRTKRLPAVDIGVARRVAIRTGAPRDGSGPRRGSSRSSPRPDRSRWWSEGAPNAGTHGAPGRWVGAAPTPNDPAPGPPPSTAPDPGQGPRSPDTARPTAAAPVRP